MISSLTHWWFGSIINCFGFCWVHHNFFQPFQLVFREIFSRFDVLSCFCIHVIVRDYLDKLWEMVWIPFSIPREKNMWVKANFKGVLSRFCGTGEVASISRLFKWSSVPGQVRILSGAHCKWSTSPSAILKLHWE